MADNDYQDCFLNFPLYRDLQKLCGVDVTELFPELAPNEGQKMIGIWLRNAMGLCTSPYSSVQGALRAKHIIMGKRDDENNAFQWDQLILNLPFVEDYQANFSRFLKVRMDEDLASEVV